METLIADVIWTHNAGERGTMRAVGRRGGAVSRAGLGPETDRLKDTDDDDEDDDVSVSLHYA